jgi:hypothetical protein
MSASEWQMVGSGSGGRQAAERVDDYRLILELAGARDGWETPTGLARKCLTAYGGNETTWRRRVRELIRGKGLRLAVQPDAIRRKRTERLFVVPGVDPADAIRSALPPRQGSKVPPVITPRARTRARVGAVPQPATAPPGSRPPADQPEPRVRLDHRTGLPMPPADPARLRRSHEAVADQITDAEWWAMSPAMQRHVDHDRAAREARRAGTYGVWHPGGSNDQGIRTTRPDGSPPDISQPRSRMFGTD